MEGATITFPSAIKAIALYSANSVVIDTLVTLGDAQLKESLAANPHLSTTQLARLLLGSKVSLAIVAATHATGDDNLHLLLKDPRVSVRATIFSGGLSGASDSFIEELIPTLARDDARRWLASRALPADKYTRQIVARAPAYQKIELFGRTEIYSDTEILATLKTIETHRVAPLAALLDTKPELLSTFTQMAYGFAQTSIPKAVLLKVLTTPRHIFGEDQFTQLLEHIYALPLAQRRGVLYTLHRNPNLPTSMLPEIATIFLKSKSPRVHSQGGIINKHYLFRKELASPELTADWQKILTGPDSPSKLLINTYLQTLPYHYYPTLNKEAEKFDSATRAKNYVARFIAQSTTSTKPYEPMSEFAVQELGVVPPLSTPHCAPNNIKRYRSMTQEVFIKQVSPLIDPLGPSGWELFFSLASSWNSSIQDLVDTTLAAHSN